jgi:hypothetical protein
MRSRAAPPILILAAALAPGACDADPPGGAPLTALLTLSGLRAAYEQAPEEALGAGLSKVFTLGFPASYFLSAPDRVRVSPAYTQGQQTAYMTTDVWVNYSTVWLQPLYVFVSAWDQLPPARNLVDIPSVMGVGDKSAFWSPFFRVYYVVVPTDTPADRYRTVHDILADDLPVFQGGARLLTLTPPAGMEPEDPAGILLPKLQGMNKVGQAVPRTVWVDGESATRTAFDFGPDRFQWNERYEIEEQPLFFFFAKDSDGVWLPVPALPRVGGTGPLFARRPPLAPGNRPAYGSLWRLWQVRVPPAARLFVPPARRNDWNALSPAWRVSLPVAEPMVPLAPDADPDLHAFKVLADQACLRDTTKTVLTKEDLAACPWLDSQEQLERHLPAALFPSEILVACPFVAYAGNPVPTP